MSEAENIKAVEGIHEKGVSDKKQLEKEQFDVAKADKFNAAVEDAKVPGKEAVVTDEVNKPSLMEAARQQYAQGSGKTPSLSEIEQTTTQINSRIEEVKQTLQGPQVALKRSYEGLLEDKLSHIDDSLRVALDKAGLEYVPDGATEGIPTAIEKFLGFLTRTQTHLDSIGGQVAGLRKSGKEIHPADLLAVQVKVNFVQQEMELFTNVLNKGLESTKTLLNTQV